MAGMSILLAGPEAVSELSEKCRVAVALVKNACFVQQMLVLGVFWVTLSLSRVEALSAQR
jgi:hypothetical protein